MEKKPKPFPLVALCNVLKQKKRLQLLGGFAPRLSALDPAGGSAPQTPVIGSRSVRSPWALTLHFSSPSAAPGLETKTLVSRTTSLTGTRSGIVSRAFVVARILLQCVTGFTVERRHCLLVCHGC